MKPHMVLNGDTPQAVRDMIEQHGRALQQISFGDATGNSEDQNIDCTYATVKLVTVGADNAVAHNLGRVPVGYKIVRQKQKAIIWDGTASFTSTNIYLQTDTANIDVTVLIF